MVGGYGWSASWRRVALSSFALCSFAFAAPPMALKALQATNVGQAQLAFVENKGQWDSSALFHSVGQGLDYWITNSGMVFDFHPFVREGGTDAKPTGHVNGHVV